MLLWLILASTLCATWASKENAICITPDGHAGSCVDVSSCEPLLELLQTRPIPEDQVKFLRESKCNGPFPYGVCCKLKKRSAGPSPEVQPDPSQSQCMADIGFQDPNSGCCGIDSTSIDQRKISERSDAVLGESPWLALIEYRKSDRFMILCGGALISSQYVLTGAHCVTASIQKYGTPVNVILGEHDRSTTLDCLNGQCAPPAVSMPVELTIPHPEFDKSKRINDIALIRLAAAVPYTDYIRPICLSSTDIESGLFVTGWTLSNKTGAENSVKQHAPIAYFEPESCQRSYNVEGRKFQLWDKQICAGGKGTCVGSNFGGSLMGINNDRHELVGVVSFGPASCVLDDVPVVYTKVSEYNLWIRNEVQLG